MLNSLDGKLPELFLVRGCVIQENPVNRQRESRNDGLFEYRTTINGVQGVAGSNPAVPTRTASRPGSLFCLYSQAYSCPRAGSQLGGAVPAAGPGSSDMASFMT